MSESINNQNSSDRERHRMPGHGRKAAFVYNLAAELRDGFLMAIDALRSHKLRSVLTLLGILVGVFSIIVVMTAMQAMQSQITTELNVLGGQSFIVQKWPQLHFGGPAGDEKYRRRKDLTLAQGLALQKKITLARSIGLSSRFNVDDISSRFGKAAPGVSLNGESPGSFPIQNWLLQEGRILTDTDVEGGRDVCVLGYKLAQALFPFGSAPGDRIKINGIAFIVIGVLEPQGEKSGGNQDNFAVIPITTGINRFGWWRQNINIMVQAPDQAGYDDTVGQVRGALRLIRKVPPGEEDDFEITSNDSTLEQINSITLAVRIGVTFISSIALLAAGIGIMNIMLVSVTERTREIGIRRAIGAKKRNIMAQFILEAIILCEIGGVLGVIFGVVGGNLAGQLMHLPMVIPFNAIALGLGICSLVGLIFGTYPAYKAANLDPIESLRYE